jgi:hypothetical protein
MKDLAELTRQREPLTDDDLDAMRKALSEITQFHNPATFYHANIRVTIELIVSTRSLESAIARFDVASGKMVKRGNQINKWVLVFAIAAAILGALAVWVSWLSYQLALSQVGK